VAEYRSILEMVIPVIQHTTKIKKIFLGEKKPEVFIVDRPLKQREATAKEQHNYGQYACPIEDLRLADQMVRIALVGRPRNYSYWHLQYYLREAVSKILYVSVCVCLPPVAFFWFVCVSVCCLYV
jgi:hypothetical protein